MSFPITPTDKQVYKNYTYNSTDGIWEQLDINTMFPIGMMYMQLPGMSEPSALGWPGTWTNVSADYAGDFFRVEGGNAEVFEGSEQLDAFQGHGHNSGMGGGVSSTSGADGFIINTTPRQAYSDLGNFKIEEPREHGNGIPRIAAETRPINKTIRVWERTA